MSFLVTALYWLVFFTLAPLEFLVLLLLWLAGTPFDPDRRWVHAVLARWTFFYMWWIPSWDIRVLHRERLPKGPAVLVCNHQSMADIVAVLGLFRPFKFVSKASLFRLPVVGWAMSFARYVPVERGHPRSMAMMLETCRAWLRRGMPVLVFPEGTYSTAPQMLPFKRGAFVLAVEEGVPVVPVAIQGTRELTPGDRPLFAARARVRVEVLAPIPPSRFVGDPEALSREVRHALERALAR